MKAYKITGYILDFEGFGLNEYLNALGNNKYANLIVTESAEAEIGEWSDDHPLNQHDADLSEYFGA